MASWTCAAETARETARPTRGARSADLTDQAAARPCATDRLQPPRALDRQLDLDRDRRGIPGNSTRFGRRNGRRPSGRSPSWALAIGRSASSSAARSRGSPTPPRALGEREAPPRTTARRAHKAQCLVVATPTLAGSTCDNRAHASPSRVARRPPAGRTRGARDSGAAWRSRRTANRSYGYRGAVHRSRMLRRPS